MLYRSLITRVPEGAGTMLLQHPLRQPDEYNGEDGDKMFRDCCCSIPKLCHSFSRKRIVGLAVGYRSPGLGMSLTKYTNYGNSVA